MKRTSVVTVLSMMAILLPDPPPAQAYLILGEEDWDPPPAAAWTNVYGWTSLTTPNSGGHTGGWLQVTFPAVDPEGGTGWYDVVYMKATNLFAGQWDTNMWIEFDFWASNKSPGALQLQWQSSTNSDVWGTTLNPGGTGTWSTLSASFMNWQNWMYDGATEGQYLSDLATIDWIGVYIYRNGADGQVYGIDDFKLMIPEPGELIMLGAAIATSLAALRRKRRNTA